MDSQLHRIRFVFQRHRNVSFIQLHRIRFFFQRLRNSV